MSHPRLPRFRRVPNPFGIELTDRDREILRHVQRHRFLRSSHLVPLVVGSRQHLLRRLQRLFHHGYLDRPRCQIDSFQRGGSRALAYGLGPKAASVLQTELQLPLRSHAPRGPASDVGRIFLDHTLLIADVLVGLELACRKHPDIRWIPAEELSGARRPHDVFRWSVSLPQRVRCGVIPDAVFALEFDGDARPRSYFFLEADRATMPVVRKRLSQSSFFRKLLAYEATWEQGLHRTRFGFHRFRVLTVTSSPSRVTSLLDACRQLERGQGLFLFTDADTFRASPDPLKPLWKSTQPDSPESLLPTRPIRHGATKDTETAAL